MKTPHPTFRAILQLILALFTGGAVFIVLLEPPAEPGGETTPLDALTWWYSQRALPFDRVPRGAFPQAAQRLKTTFRKEHGRTADATGAWSSIGPTNIGGRTLSIALNPQHPDTVWAGTASGGLWRSTTGGEGPNPWQYVNTGFPALSVSTIAIDSLNPNTMYIGTGEISFYKFGLVGVRGARASYGLGVLKSTDAGATWDTTGLNWEFADINAVLKIVINPVNPNTVFAATSEGVYKSTNAGATWYQVNAEPMAMDIAIDYADTTLIMAAHGNLNSTPSPGMYLSDDGGETWNIVGGGLPTSDFGRTALAASRSNPQIVYAGVSNGSTSGIIGLYKTTNFGTTWTPVSSANYVGSQGWYDNVVAVDPTNPFNVLANGLDMYRSTNGGPNLAPLFTGVHVDHHAAVYHPSDPSIVYVGSDGGMWKSTDGGTSYLNLNSGFVTTQFYPGFSCAWDDSTVSLGGLQDNGTLRYHGATDWDPVWGGDGGWTAIDPVHRNIMYAESQYLALVRSTNGGANFTSITAGLPTGDANTNFIPPFVLSTASPNVLYAGARNVYKTVNSGGTWSPANGSSSALNGTKIACIGVSWTSPDTLMTGTGSSIAEAHTFKIYASTNGGAVWADVTSSLPDRYPTDIEFDPYASAVAYLTYSGYLTPHVFKTTNLGATWQDITANLPDLPCQAVTVDPEDPSILYVGNDLGVFRSTDGGTTWEDFGSGMPQAMVLDLVFSRSNRVLRAGTFGNGVYERPVPVAPAISVTRPNGGESWSAGSKEQIRWDLHYVKYVDIAYSSDNGATWAPIADSVWGYGESFLWTLPLASTTQGRIRISDAATGTVLDMSDAPFTILAAPDIMAGWNLISLPVRPADASVTTLFPDAISNAFAYTTAYVIHDTLRNGLGYWLKFPGAEYMNLSGDAVAADTIPLQAGWNLIGSVSTPLPVSAAIASPPGVIASQYFSYAASYIVADSLKPKKGYWVKASADGELILSPSSSVAGAARAADMDLASLTSLKFTDARGNSQTLYVARSADERLCAEFELPPAPPSGFDVRFRSGSMVTGGAMALSVTVAAYPVTVRWDVRESSCRIELRDGSFRELTNAGKMTVLGADQLPARIVSSTDPAVPERIALLQNYPNPFNPETAIRFTLPAPERVRLEIFNTTGASAALLADATLDAGTHEYRWNAANFPSGVYFVRLTSSTLRETRKMLLVR